MSNESYVGPGCVGMLCAGAVVYITHAILLRWGWSDFAVQMTCYATGLAGMVGGMALGFVLFSLRNETTGSKTSITDPMKKHRQTVKSIYFKD
ncbi:hypothetical protein UFOVP66_18 [uncultured Caudovirales phage]|uniref:Uncharacterized protein n=1 Tax=uncultured Caudovirales phage TaxID=2100421 RepID=A0A6J5KQD0_9CAUD|nr:hypothetical protein UFOVP66_18 [uncultured Caudovirales phage]